MSTQKEHGESITKLKASWIHVDYWKSGDTVGAAMEINKLRTPEVATPPPPKRWLEYIVYYLGW